MKRSAQSLILEGSCGAHIPVHTPRVTERYDHLINYTINANRSTYKLDIERRVLSDEIVLVETKELVAPDTSSHGRDMINAWLSDHGLQSSFRILSMELKTNIVFPQGLEIDINLEGLSYGGKSS